ncbi:MAG: DUF2892 domain-containing protein [Candidatus Schekmanbacteria bacterium]|nr:DUF2892 domain-containing protein [Candidatus Schekmanbacteria bacterium]
MRLERGLRLVAGAFILISLVGYWLHSPYWLLFTLFVGFNLFQSGFSNWCPMKSLLHWLGLKTCEEEIAEIKKGGHHD